MEISLKFPLGTQYGYNYVFWCNTISIGLLLLSRFSIFFNMIQWKFFYTKSRNNTAVLTKYLTRCLTWNFFNMEKFQYRIELFLLYSNQYWKHMVNTKTFTIIHSVCPTIISECNFSGFLLNFPCSHFTERSSTSSKETKTSIN